MRSRVFVPLVLIGLTLAIFWEGLFLPNDRVLSAKGDIFNFFVYWRQFGFGQMKAGHIALWNPYTFSGAPFMGGLQSALFYPPNWIYLVLPPAKAINCEIALHVFLMGLFIALWVEHYRLHPMAALLAGSIVMFGGAFFLHVFAGHLAPMDATAWLPLILLVMDGTLDEPGPKWILLGIFAFAMQLLAGFPLMVFDTVFTCAVYVAIRLRRAPRPVDTVLALALVGAGAILITTVQLWTGLQVAADSTRSGGMSFGFVGSFSLPPQNLLTFVVPGFFGNMTSIQYWGRSFLWESSVFLGLTGLTMALFGASLKVRQKSAWTAMAALLFVLALGSHTPLLKFFYRHVPGFNFFREPSEFRLPAICLLTMLAAFGMDAVIRSARGAKTAALILLIGAIALGGIGTCLWLDAGRAVNALWSECFAAIRSREVVPLRDGDAGFVAAARQFAGSQCLISAAILLALAGQFLLRAFHPRAAYLLAAFGIAEAFIFARSAVTSSPISTAMPAEVATFIKAHPGDYRTLGLANEAMVSGPGDIFGYDPVESRRYADFISYSQGGTGEDTANITPGSTLRYSPLLRLLRLRFVFSKDAGGYHATEVGGGLPHLLLVNDWRQIGDRDQVLDALSAPSFDPQKTVILETPPDPTPVDAGPPGSVRLLSRDTNAMSIEAEVARPTLLLITDSYSRYWRAVPLPGSIQSSYQVLPADWTLMAIPLGAGHHLLRVEYAPSGYILGRWISLVSLLAYLVALGAFVWRR